MLKFEGTKTRGGGLRERFRNRTSAGSGTLLADLIKSGDGIATDAAPLYPSTPRTAPSVGIRAC
jgi:hypothetical protein